MIKVIFVLAITVALESAYLMASVGNWICVAWALASIPWVILTNYFYDNGIGKVNKIISKQKYKIPRNGLGDIKYGIKTVITNYETGVDFIKEILIAKLIVDGCKLGHYALLKYNTDRIFDGLMINMKIKNEAKRNKTVLIMRGVPGSGKSKLADMFTNAGAIIHSTDNYHIDKDGVYRFNREELGYYHMRNYEEYCKSVDKGKEMIVVDNTNFKPSLYRDYVEYAKENGYLVYAFVFKPADIELHMKRCIHNVPLKTLEHMHKVMLDNMDTIGADYNFIIEVK